MRKLLTGIHSFQREIFASYRHRFRRLAEGQAPEALFITCADSRLDPGLLTQTEPGDLFVLRNAGNLVPAYDAAGASGEAATIEFAVRRLGIADIVVCGHSHCGAVAALLAPETLEDAPALAAWLQHGAATREMVRQRYGTLDAEAQRNVATQEHVLLQLEHLRTHPAVAEALQAGRMRLHAWVYKFETGEVFAYDPAAEQFLPLDAGRYAAAVP